MYNLSFEQGEVIDIIKEDKMVTFVWVKLPGKEKCKSVNYQNLTGLIHIGDPVIVNTTAVKLGLGTGGYHFVVLNLKNLNFTDNYLSTISNIPGHIMKMRYTPFQIKTFCAEEPSSPHHEQINKFESLNGFPVIILPLHSLLAPLSITYKNIYPDKRIVYIMSEGGSLALDFSILVQELILEGYIDNTITYGNAFGGDFETVNIFTALAVAVQVLRADLIIVGMGPGIVGTSTKYGFSGVENAFIDKAVRILKGKSIVVPRISFADKRERHFGISHHSLTLLKDLITEPVELSFPDNEYLREQINKNNLKSKHNIDYYPINEVKNILEQSSFSFNSMGRCLKDDPLFFITAGLAVYKL